MKCCRDRRKYLVLAILCYRRSKIASKSFLRKTQGLNYHDPVLTLSLVFIIIIIRPTRGHPFITSTRKSCFEPPLPVHMRPRETNPHPSPCGRPHVVDIKYTVAKQLVQ